MVCKLILNYPFRRRIWISVCLFRNFSGRAILHEGRIGGRLRRRQNARRVVVGPILPGKLPLKGTRYGWLKFQNEVWFGD